MRSFYFDKKEITQEKAFEICKTEIHLTHILPEPEYNRPVFNPPCRIDRSKVKRVASKHIPKYPI